MRATYSSFCAPGIPHARNDKSLFGREASTSPSLPINLPHDDVDRANDGGDVGDQAAATDFVRYAEIAKAGGSCPHTQRDGIFGGPGDDVKAHLAAGAFGFHVGFSRRQSSRRLDPVGALSRRVLLERLLGDL